MLSVIRSLLLSPINLLFFIILLGVAIGKLRIRRVSLGVAGILFAAILVGFLTQLWILENKEIIASIQEAMKTFSKLGSSLFVAVIGLQTGFSVRGNSKGATSAFIIGCLMSISGVTVMLLISTFDKTIGYASLLGTLCGALTSTPGLASVGELLLSGNEEAVMGYGCSYPFGVILVVFLAQVFSRKEKKNQPQAHLSKETNSKAYPELMLIAIVALFGNLLGNTKIASTSISFGATASTLIVGLVIGLVVHKSTSAIVISAESLNIFRNLGLALFFAGTGFSTGVQSIRFDIKTVLYGLLMTLIPILCGWLFCKIVSARVKLHNGFIIAGGMTSSPAYGALSTAATEESINDFSFSYFGICDQADTPTKFSL